MGRFLLVLMLLGAAVFGLPELKKRIHPKATTKLAKQIKEKEKEKVKDKTEIAKGLAKTKSKDTVATAQAAHKEKATVQPVQGQAKETTQKVSMAAKAPAEPLARPTLPEKKMDPSQFEDLSEDLK